MAKILPFLRLGHQHDALEHAGVCSRGRRLAVGVLALAFAVSLPVAAVAVVGSADSRIEVSGKVRRAILGGPVPGGQVEIRWPERDDRYRPVIAAFGEDGAYSVTFASEAFDGRVDELTVSAMAKGFTVKEKRLVADAGGGGGAYTLDFELMPATVDGVLDIFGCCILSWTIATVMLPAFFLGAAVKAFVPSHQFLRFLGPSAPKPVSYGAAVGAGMVLSLCSCNVIPLFLSIWRSGAGIGPAFAFLYAGPAINVVSMVFACRVIGLGIGLWRTIAVAVVSLVVGMLMAVLFGRGNERNAVEPVDLPGDAPESRTVVVLLALLLALLVVGSLELSVGLRACTTAPLVLAVLLVARWRLDKEHRSLWLSETRDLVLRVIPVLVPAVLLIGFLAQKTPLGAVHWLVGGNTLAANAVAAVTGALMYFPILTETAMAKTLLKVMGMGIGPGMALLLTGPGLSLPGMVIVAKEIGWRRLGVYVAAVAVLATASGWFFGSSWGSYLCSCEYK